MYEEYTDKQIVEMLKPKLEKLGYTSIFDNPKFYEYAYTMIAVIYKSGYVRGQFGRSFIIGEKKEKVDKTGRWVFVNDGNIKGGSFARYIDEKVHEISPEFYPAKDVVGKVVRKCDDNTYLVQWTRGSTSGTDRWFSAWSNLEVLIDEPVKVEKWVPATKDNVKIGSKVKCISNTHGGKRDRCFPEIGVVGEVIKTEYHGCYIQWPKATTMKDDLWWYCYDRLEVLVCE